MKKILLLIAISIAAFSKADAQGCVAIRSTGGLCTDGAMNHAKPSNWAITVNNRYFKSFKHFVGTEEQKQRAAAKTEVINYSYTMDIILTRNLNPRWSLSLDIPIVSNARSSLYEHDGKKRYSTHSFGLGDVRFSGYAWIIDPTKLTKGNVQVGLGLKLPTGDYKYQDFFVKSDSVKVLGPVDQSIQLGDGGLGFSTEVNAYYNFNHFLGAYGNFYYLFSPREQNGTSTARGGTPSSTALLYGSSTMSVPDQYMLRAGINLSVKKFVISLGVRDECLPSKDLIGESGGFRRPGYIISFEPGVTYNAKRFSVYGYVPYALKRSRTQSYADIARTKATGVYTQGDAAFADYLVNVGASFRF